MEPRSERHKPKKVHKQQAENSKKSIIIFNAIIVCSLFIIGFAMWKTGVFSPVKLISEQQQEETQTKELLEDDVEIAESGDKEEGKTVSEENSETNGKNGDDEQTTDASEQLPNDVVDAEKDDNTPTVNGKNSVDTTAVNGKNVDDTATVDGKNGNEAGTVGMAFVGDILISDYIQPIVDQYGYDYLFEPALLYLSEPDITVGNLEMPITKAGKPIDQKYVYKGSPNVIQPLLDAGFDMVSLANNHAYDQGKEGLLDTIAHLDKAGLAHAGTGNNSTEAYKPVIKEVNGVSIAFVSLSHVIPYAEFKVTDNRAGIAETYDVERATQAVEDAKQAADVVVVLIHWGEERVTTLSDKQLSLGKAYIDAGADLVIGHHPHILQGFEEYKGKWIAYSLGNFIFSSYPKDAEAETGVLDAVCSKAGDCQLQFHPMEVKMAQPVPMEEEMAQQLFEKLQSISVNAKVDSNGKIMKKSK
ncbi:CapA family protein [Paenibacillus yanchengensis]|uniref:CapA family protein n=1 Tax=Paenibacillus yanchengensis TaxID=2035833 RepID=A0ABW4YNM2_9BACL